MPPRRGAAGLYPRLAAGLKWRGDLRLQIDIDPYSFL
jgi:hypothetical protein